MAKYNQFAGVNALTHNAESLAQAVKMDGARAKKELIYEKTGWFKDADDRWKFEISDHDASLKDGWREAVVENGSLPLDHVLVHDKLFENYPQLKGISVELVETDEFWGEFDERNNKISIKSTIHDDSVLNTLCHETNHSIQEIEKFGMGGTNTHDGKLAMLRYLDRLIEQSRSSKSIYRTERDAYRSSLDAEMTRARIEDIAVARDAARLVNYAHSSSPSRNFRNVRNALAWVDSERFKDSNGETAFEAREILDDYLNIPRSNRKNMRNDAIADVCIKAAQLLRRSVAPTHLMEMKESGRSYESLLKSEERILERQKKAAQGFYDLESEVEKLVQTRDRMSGMTGRELYYALNGEETSRATEKRLKLTESERMDIPPWLSMLSPDRQVSILYKDGYKYQGNKSYSAIEQVNKASIEFCSDYFAKMLLHPLSDASSVMHESAHYFLEVMSDLNIRDGVKQSLRDDFNDVLNYLDITEIEWYSMSDDEKEQYHEKFAEGFEDYLINGEVKNSAISNVFEKLKCWISAIYEKFGANKLSSCSGAEHIYEKLLTGDGIDMSEHSELFAAIGDNISVDVKDATDAVYSASMGYFSNVSGLSQSDLTHKYNLLVEHDGISAKNELISDAELATMTQDDYEKVLSRNGFNTGKVLFHGTASTFDKFDDSYFNKNEESGDYVGCAHYFATTKQKALAYAKQAGGDIIKEVFLKQESPLVIEKGGNFDKRVYEDIDPTKYFSDEEIKVLGDDAKYYSTFEMSPTQVADYMKSKGFDGLLDNDYGQAAVFSADNIMPSSVDELRLQRGICYTNEQNVKNTLTKKF